MLINVHRVLQILADQSNHNRPEEHGKLMEMIVNESLDASGLIRVYDKDSAKNPEYWTPIFEAYITGQFQNAHHILISFQDVLHVQRFTVCHSAYPCVMLAFLKAATWYYESGVPNQVFSDTFARVLAEMLKDYADGGASIDTKEPGMWVLGQFSSAFNAYFDSKNPDVFWRRMFDFTGPLSEIKVVGPKAQKLLEEVSLRLLFLMPLPMRLETLAHRWDAAKKLHEANETRQAALPLKA